MIKFELSQSYFNDKIMENVVILIKGSIKLIEMFGIHKFMMRLQYFSQVKK